MASLSNFRNDFNGSTFGGQWLDFNTTAATASSTQCNLNYDSSGTAFGTAAGTRLVTNSDVQIESFTDTTADTTPFGLGAFTASTQRMSAIAAEGNATFRFSDYDLVDNLKNALMQIFTKVPKDLVKTDEDKKLVLAKEKSEKLLKSWLSPKEYQGLLNKGELEIPSIIDKDTIFIIKRDPNEMVQVRKNGENQHRLCAVAEDLEMPVGDQLLSKFLLLKTDEKKFKEIAIKH